MVVKPGSTVGIIGGGQLGRMMALSAAELGYRVHIYTDQPDSPASHVSYETTEAYYHDQESIAAFASHVDVITVEFENIPHQMVQQLADKVPVNPSWNALFITQNRVREKEFVQAQGIKTTPFFSVHSFEELVAAVEKLGCPCLLKTAEMGYDGKGQYKITDETSLADLWESFGNQLGIVEGWVPFVKEISVVICRNTEGKTACFPIGENVHEDGILSTCIAPADIDHEMAANAKFIAETLAKNIELVGTLAVELFVTGNGELLVNELAPRPHNSGHYTINACVTSQFEQHIRAVCGLPLGDISLLSPAKMVNLIGDDLHDWEEFISNPSAKLHLYGKQDVKKGRKMGHVTILTGNKQ